MRLSTTVLAFASVCLGAAFSQALADEVVYVPHEKVSAALTTPGTLANGTDHNVSMSRRDGTGQSEVHDGETDVFYVMEGSATFVTGGTVTEGKTTRPGQIRGTGIAGGETHMLSQGDIIVVPKGTPHWFKEVPDHIVYFVVKAK